MSGAHVALARGFRAAVAEAWGRPLTMNVSMPIAAVMLDLGLRAERREGRAHPRPDGGLLAHLAEEQRGARSASRSRPAAEDAVDYEAG